MAQRVQRLRFGLGTVVVALGVALLVASFAAFLDGTGSTLAINGPPLLFVSAVIVLRIGVLMSERRLCSACGEPIERMLTQCPSCDEALPG